MSVCVSVGRCSRHRRCQAFVRSFLSVYACVCSCVKSHLYGLIHCYFNTRTLCIPPSHLFRIDFFSYVCFTCDVCTAGYAIQTNKPGNKKHQPIIFLFFLLFRVFLSVGFRFVSRLFSAFDLASLSLVAMCVGSRKPELRASQTKAIRSISYSLETVHSNYRCDEVVFFGDAVLFVYISIHRWRRRRRRQRSSIFNLINWTFFFNLWFPPSSLLCVCDHIRFKSVWLKFEQFFHFALAVTLCKWSIETSKW